jgi:hypothetical protein
MNARSRIAKNIRACFDETTTWANQLLELILHGCRHLSVGRARHRPVPLLERTAWTLLQMITVESRQFHQQSRKLSVVGAIAIFVNRDRWRPVAPRAIGSA